MYRDKKTLLDRACHPATICQMKRVSVSIEGWVSPMGKPIYDGVETPNRRNWSTGDTFASKIQRILTEKYFNIGLNTNSQKIMRALVGKVCFFIQTFIKIYK